MVLSKEYFSRVAEIFLAGGSYIFFHEFGHFLFAVFMGLGPSFVTTSQTAGMTGMSLMSVGVSYAATSVSTSLFAIMGGTIVPLLVAAGLFTYGLKRGNETLMTVSEIYLILIILNLIPFGGMEISDGYRLWEVFNIYYSKTII